MKFENLSYDANHINICDVLLSSSKLFKTHQEGWLGYIQTPLKGEHSGATIIAFLPVIDLNPTSYSCVYTSRMFISNVAKRQHVESPIVIFDLWGKDTGN